MTVVTRQGNHSFMHRKQPHPKNMPTQVRIRAVPVRCDQNAICLKGVYLMQSYRLCVSITANHILVVVCLVVFMPVEECAHEMNKLYACSW